MLQSIGPAMVGVIRDAPAPHTRGEASGDSFASLLALAGSHDAVAPADAHDDPEAARAERRAALREAVQGIESFFLNEMISRMRKTIPDGGLIPKGFAEDVYEGMYYEKLAGTMASAGGIGLGELLYRQLEPHVDREV